MFIDYRIVTFPSGEPGPVVNVDTGLVFYCRVAFVSDMCRSEIPHPLWYDTGMCRWIERSSGLQHAVKCCACRLIGSLLLSSRNVVEYAPCRRVSPLGIFFTAVDIHRLTAALVFTSLIIWADASHEAFLISNSLHVRLALLDMLPVVFWPGLCIQYLHV